MTRAEFTAVLPVKELAVAKSRLGASAAARAALALAMAQDVAVAAAATRGVVAVLLVTDDPLAAAGVAATWVEPDAPRAGLSAAAAHGAAVAAHRRPHAGVAVLAADLPALQPGAFAAVLAALSAGCGVVADGDGVGTVLLAATAGTAVAPQFEGGSYARHRAAGASDLTALADAGLRRDVDTVADLARALDLGVGPATAAAVAAYRSDWRAAGLH